MIATLCAVAALFSSPALAQDDASQSDQAASGGQIARPAACQETASQGGQMDMAQMDSTMQGMMASMTFRRRAWRP